MRLTACLLVMFSGAALGAAVAAGSGPLVPCGNVIAQVSGPRTDGYRPVLGVLSVPPTVMRRGAVRVDGFRPWTYWFKAGMVVRGGRFSVAVSVPRAWRSRVAITWGGSGVVSSLRFSGCGDADLYKGWNGYAGGFYLRSATACVPLVFKLGNEATTVRFGIGRRC